MALPISIQLYTLREALQQDFAGVIRKLAAIGFVAVEPWGGIPVPAAQAASLFRELGLQVPSAHTNLPIGDDARQLLDSVATYGAGYIFPSTHPRDFDTLEAVKQVCERFNQALPLCQEYGIQLGVHNHWWEFQVIEGQRAYDVMLKTLDPAILFEIDTYWVQVGGADPAQIVRQIGERSPILHIKDGPADDPKAPMVAVGAGTLDFPAIIAAGGPHTQWLVVELDRCATDMMAAVRESYDYLTRKGLAHGRQS